MIIALIIIAICLVLNAFLSGVEMAFITVSRPHLRKLAAKGDRLALILIKLRSNPERVLSVLQVGISLVGAISAAVGGAGAEENLGPFFENVFALSSETAEYLAIALVVVPLTFFSVVVGELVPKALALKFPLRLARLGALFLVSMDRIFLPVVWFLELSTKLIIKPIFKLLPQESHDKAVAHLDIDALSENNKQYVLNLINVDKKKAKDILVPWEEVIKLQSDTHHFEVLAAIRKFRHTRLPVIIEGLPVGILHTKDFIAENEVAKMDWHQLIRPVIRISGEDTILNILKLLQQKQAHMAIVYSKAGQILGIITMEDIFEELVGDLYDEDDNPQVLLSSNAKLRAKRT